MLRTTLLRTTNPPKADKLNLCLLVRRVFAAFTAKLAKGNLALHQLFILAGVVVAALTDRTAKFYLVFVSFRI